ncbi:MAG: hypothetical protein V2I33_03970 [Kangiellaceae bacterium]|jgi:hypothetical protein|nr:hypothetical protein [Kangiellaceae bacterium]
MKKYKDFSMDIMGQKWRVKFVPVLVKNEEGEVAGICDFPDKILWISMNQDHEHIIITIFHELFHAYTRRSGIYNATLSHDTEEIIADQFATVIAENFDFKL